MFIRPRLPVWPALLYGQKTFSILKQLLNLSSETHCQNSSLVLRKHSDWTAGKEIKDSYS